MVLNTFAQSRTSSEISGKKLLQELTFKVLNFTQEKFLPLFHIFVNCFFIILYSILVAILRIVEIFVGTFSNITYTTCTSAVCIYSTTLTNISVAPRQAQTRCKFPRKSQISSRPPCRMQLNRPPSSHSSGVIITLVR